MNDEDAVSSTTAAEWRELRLALSTRLKGLARSRDGALDDEAKAKIQTEIDELKRQIKILAVEESVAKFTEDAERYIIASSAISEELSRDPDAEIA